MNRTAILILAALLGLLAPAPTRAQVASPMEEPYALTVVLRFADHSLLTPLFVDQVRRQTQDQLATYFGPLAQVQVVARHPLLEALGGLAWDELNFAAEDFDQHKVTGKVFLVSIDYRDAAYRIGWRQLDGEVQQVGPWRTTSTIDRPWVPKAVCLAVVQDFAPVALIKPRAGGNGKEVDLEFRGAVHSDRLAQVLGDQCILQPWAVVRQQDGTLVRTPVANTVLRIASGKESQRAEVVSNSPQPWRQTARIVGYQAVKLRTQSGRLRLRLLDIATGGPVLRCTVHANARGFETLADRDLLPSPDREGYVVSPGSFDGLAFVRIAQGGSAVQVPLPITSDWCELTCKISVDQAAAEKAEWNRQLRFLAQDLRVLQAAVDGQVRQVNGLHTNKRYEDACKLIQGALPGLATNIEGATASKNQLEHRAHELEMGSPPLLAWAAGQIVDLESRKQDLTHLAASLDQTIQKIDAQSRADVLIDLARQALREGNIDECLDKYDLALAEQPNQPELKEELAALRETWRIKSPAHQAARQFAFERWLKTEVTEIGKRLPEAEQAFQTLRGVSDHLSVRRLFETTAGHVAALTELTEALASDQAQADPKEIEQYVQLTTRIVAFQEQLGGYLTNPTASVGTSPTSPTPTSPPRTKAAKSTQEEEEPPPKK